MVRLWRGSTFALVCVAGATLAACGPGEPSRPSGPTRQYGFVTRLGNDTVALESVTRGGDKVTSDEVDRFPIVRHRHTEMTLAADGSIRHMDMDIRTPSEPEKQRERHVTVDVKNDTVFVTKRDAEGGKRWVYPKPPGSLAMPHLPQMYSLYELYIAAALQRAESLHKATGIADSIQVRQYYIDREFDRFPLHRGIVWRDANGKVEIAHDWLSGIGEATVDSSRELLGYSGARTTYKVDVERLAQVPDVAGFGARQDSLEAKSGPRQLSARDLMGATIGAATFSVDYGRPLARGRVLLGGIVPYDRVWRTGANAATQFSTSAPITLAGIPMPAGKYTLWTLPHANGVELIVNKQTGQWGTSYDQSADLRRAPMATQVLATPVEQFTISILPSGPRNGTLAMEWGPFRWTAPIVVR